MLPVIWEAFREWWKWRESFTMEETGEILPPYVDFDILTNSFYRMNPTIWSVWHIRFAYETGAKCLYSNLPGNLSLVSNYREKGENYAASMGSRTTTLLPHHIRGNRGSVVDENNISIYDLTTPSQLWSFPLYSRLVHEQYDFSLRRPGRKKHSIDSIFVTAESKTKVMDKHKQQLPLFQDSVDCSSNLIGDLFLSERHWQMIRDMIEVHLAGLRETLVVLHIEPAFDDDYFRNLGVDNASVIERGFNVNNVLLSTKCAEWRETNAWGDIHECILLPDSLLLLSTAASSLKKYSFRMVIIDEETAVECLKQRISSIWEVLRDDEFSHILMLGTCVEAPTSMTLIPSPTRDLVDNDHYKTWEFFLLEDVCSERPWTDAGAVLYRRVERSMSADREFSKTYLNDKYYLSIKRHPGNIITRRAQRAYHSFLYD